MNKLTLSLACLSLILTFSVQAKEDAHKDHHPNESAAEHAEHDKDSHAGETEEDHAKHANEHDHAADKAKHGGILAYADGYHYEFVADNGKLLLISEDFFDKHDPKATKVRLTLLQDSKKTVVNLMPSTNDKHHFEAKKDIKLSKGDKVVALIRSGKEKPRLVRFEVGGK